MNTRTSSSCRLPAAILISAAVFATAASINAASIDWSAPTGISAESDVSTNGSLVGAFNLGPRAVSNTIINGVAFTGLALSGLSDVTSGNFNLKIVGTTFSSASITPVAAPYGLLSAAYREMLSTPAGDFLTPFTLTMSGLLVGETYEFQWWSNSSNGFSTPTTATAGNAVILDSNTTGVSGGLGQFAIGTFMADNVSQQIVFSTDNQTDLNGFQLRQITPAVPEPGSAALGLLVPGVCAWWAATRRRRTAHD